MISGSELAALAIFPLPRVVLFPGAFLPLHIFEPRYREMIRDVLDGSNLLAMANLRPGFEADADTCPAVCDVAGVGSVVEHQQLPDGRFNILLLGEGRIRIEQELPQTRSYRRVRARLIEDEAWGGGTEHAELLALCERLARGSNEVALKLSTLARNAPGPGACADVVTAALLGDPGERQRVLEMTRISARLEVAMGLVQDLIVRLAPSPNDLN